MTTSHRLLALLAAASLAFGACGDDDDPEAIDATTSTSTTEGSGTDTTDEESTSTTGGATGTSAGGASTTSVVGSTIAGAPAESSPEGVIELSIVGGNVEGGVRREKIKQGSQVTLRVTSDVADELHVHTYDLKVDLVPGQSADLTFLARIPGVHEVELEERHKKVLELEVSA